MMKRLLFATLLVVAAVTTVTAQNSFIVADKNGNSQLVQSLIFQQQQNGFTWKADDSKTGDIKDLLFIARTNQTLSSGTAADVTAMLEELSGTDQADAEAVAAALQDNPNVEEAFSADGCNVVVKSYGDDVNYIYPMFSLKTPFSELPDVGMLSSANAMRSPNRASGGTGRSVAIFNFFDGLTGYEVQDKITRSIWQMFKKHHYIVDYYGGQGRYDNEFGDYIKEFTFENVASVLHQSFDFKSYDVIIIMSHGAILEDGRSYFATRDENLGISQFEIGGKNYYAYDTDEIYKYHRNGILYLGYCNSVVNGTIPTQAQCPTIGYKGITCMAEANAAIMFHLMLNEGKSMKTSYASLVPEPGKTKSESMVMNSAVTEETNLAYDTDLISKYETSCKATFKNESNFSDVSSSWWYSMDGVYVGDTYPKMTYTYLKPILSGVGDNFIYSKFANTETIGGSHIFHAYCETTNQPEGIYQCVVNGLHVVGYSTYDNNEKLKFYNIEPTTHCFVVCSRNYKDHDAEPVSESSLTAPSVFNSSGQTVEAISLSAQTSQTFSISGYSGHSFNAVSLDTDIATVSVSGTTLTVKGVTEGKTYIGVYDVQNNQMAVAEVTVTAGGGDIVAYTSCPDDHHPHLIDLGLPSGTKWACCNVGASKPLDRGGYYAWGETTEKSTYTSSNYLDGKGSTYYIGSDIAGTQYDAATANWGSPWVMPSKEQCKELDNNCTSEWTTENGVNGRRFTSPNGASIFLPAAGFRDVTSLRLQGSYGSYFSSSLSESETYYAYELGFYSGSVYTLVNGRYFGRSVRPVRKN